MFKIHDKKLSTFPATFNFVFVFLVVVINTK